MADLATLLDRTTPDDLGPLNLDDLARRGHHRRRRQRAGLTVASVVVVAVALSALIGREDADRAGSAVWTGPAGEVLTEPVGSWTQAEDPPFSPRQGAFGGTLSDGRVLIWGGTDGSGWQLDGGIYDPSTGDWEAIPSAPLPVPVTNSRDPQQVVLVDDRLLVLHTVEPRDGTVRAAVYVRGRWVALPAISLVPDYEVAWDGETVALVDVQGAPVTWRWSLGDDSWHRGAPAPIGSRTAAARAFDGRRLAVWGGSTSTGALPEDGAIYDVTTDRWETIPAAPISGGEYPMVAWFNGRVVVSLSTVGAPLPREQFDDVGRLAAYDPVTGRWSMLPTAPDFSAATAYPYTMAGHDNGLGTARFLVTTVDVEGVPGGPGARWFLRSNRWERARYADLRQLGAFSVAMYEGAAGFRGESAVPLIEVRVEQDQWLDAAFPPTGRRSGATIVATGDKLVLVGGWVHPDNHDADFAGDAWVYDLAGHPRN